MVATMRKYVFLAYHRDYNHFLHELRDLGMIHVTEQGRTEMDDEQLETHLAQAKQLMEAEKILRRKIDKKSNESLNEPNVEFGRTIPAEIEKIENQKLALNQQLQVAIKEKEALKPWGNFDPEVIKLLEKEGYKLSFFIAPNIQYDQEWEKLYDIIIVEKSSSRTYFVVVSRGENMSDRLNLEEEKLPDVSLHDINQIIASLEEKIKRQEEDLNTLARDLPSLEVALKEVESEISFTRVAQSGTPVADNKVFVLQGWSPEENVEEISQLLKEKSVYFEVFEPGPEDDVPIKFKNNRFTRLFEPIAELYMLPKYNEIDLTPFFAPFYMIFFGLSLGDIGYGAFILLMTTLALVLKKDTLSKSMRGVLTLAQILGASTMVCGLLTGGFFGYSIYDINVPFFQNMKDQVFFDNSQMFMLSLILGVVQIMFGMFIKIFNRTKQFGFPHAISSLGWFLFLLSFIAAYLFPSLMPMGGTLHYGVMIVTGVLIVFFNSPGKNILVNIGTSLWDTYNMATGLLGDILSYIRLFALGLSGGILASVFSSLASGMSPDNAILGPLVTVLIFVAGHAINMFMNALGAFVHPLRLTFVEFYNNSDFTGGGKKFTPFKK